LGQLVTVKMADYVNKKHMLFWGMFIQGLTLFAMIWADSFLQFWILASILGIGTSIEYPTFLAAIADYTHPGQRAKSIGIFRLWRDLGYAIGAVLTGVIADVFSISWAVGTIGLLTVFSAVIILVRMREQ
jgi:MFS family permease